MQPENLKFMLGADRVSIELPYTTQIKEINKCLPVQEVFSFFRKALRKWLVLLQYKSAMNIFPGYDARKGIMKIVCDFRVL